MTFYHGTTYECAAKILRSGFGGYSQDAVWDCSYEGHTYVWLWNGEEPEESTQLLAAENGLVAAAKYGSDHEEIVVFTLEAPDEIGAARAMADDSCPNMGGAYYIDSRWLNKNIKDGTVKMCPEVAKLYVPGFRWFYLACCSEENMSLDAEAEKYVRIADSFKGEIFSALQELVLDRAQFEPLDISELDCILIPANTVA